MSRAGRNKAAGGSEPAIAANGLRGRVAPPERVHSLDGTTICFKVFQGALWNDRLNRRPEAIRRTVSASAFSPRDSGFIRFQLRDVPLCQRTIRRTIARPMPAGCGAKIK